MIVVERVVEEESAKWGLRHKPFYSLRKSDGSPSRAWMNAAALAVWLKYKGYRAEDYVRAICSMPLVEHTLRQRKDQVALNMIAPSFRKSAARLRRYEDCYLRWMRKHGKEDL